MWPFKKKKRGFLLGGQITIPGIATMTARGLEVKIKEETNTHYKVSFLEYNIAETWVRKALVNIIRKTQRHGGMMIPSYPITSLPGREIYAYQIIEFRPQLFTVTRPPVPPMDVGEEEDE